MTQIKQTENTKNEKKKICPECGEPAPEEAFFCEICGARLDGKKSCLACGVTFEGKVCPACGEPAPVRNRKEKKEPVAPVASAYVSGPTIKEKTVKRKGNAFYISEVFAFLASVWSLFGWFMISAFGGGAGDKSFSWNRALTVPENLDKLSAFLAEFFANTKGVFYFFGQNFADVTKILSFLPDKSRLGALNLYSRQIFITIVLSLSLISIVISVIAAAKRTYRCLAKKDDAPALAPSSYAVFSLLCANMVFSRLISNFNDIGGDSYSFASLSGFAYAGMFFPAVLWLVAFFTSLKNGKKATKKMRVHNAWTRLCGFLALVVVFLIGFSRINVFVDNVKNEAILLSGRSSAGEFGYALAFADGFWDGTLSSGQRQIFFYVSVLSGTLLTAAVAALPALAACLSSAKRNHGGDEITIAAIAFVLSLGLLAADIILSVTFKNAYNRTFAEVSVSFPIAIITCVVSLLLLLSTIARKCAEPKITLEEDEAPVLTSHHF